MIEFFNRAIAPLKRRVQNMVSRVVLAAIKDDKDIQALQVKLFADEVSDNVERFTEYGFASHPPVGSEGIMVSVGGSRRHGVVVSTNHRGSRFKGLKENETAIYTRNGDFIHIKENGEIEVKASSKVLVTCPEAEFTGNVTIKGNLKVNGTSGLDGVVTTGADVNVGANANIGANAAVTGNVTAVGVTASGAVGGASIAAPSISVAGTELADYAAHTHTDSQGGSTSGPQ